MTHILARLVQKKIRLLFIFLISLFMSNNAEIYVNERGTAHIPENIDSGRPFTQPKKKWTIIIYIAGDNDLYPFAYRNIAQMKQVGSNDEVNILVHLDIRHTGQPKVTKRIYIEQDKVWQVGPDYLMDSGSDATLFDSVHWAINDFPSEHLALVLWNHGSGDLNPILKRTINPAQLFTYNDETGLIELDRSIGFIDFVDQLAQEEEEDLCCHRGICFDETNKTYLDDAKLIRAFTQIVKERNGKKIDIVLFDACLMAGTGTAYIMSKFVDYMVASEEVVPGPGYDYQLFLQALAAGDATPEKLARHAVATFLQTYGNKTNDYTHSALDLKNFEELHNNINLVASLLLEALQNQKRNAVKLYIKKSRSRQTCTYFDEPSYIDLGNLYENLLKNVDQISLNSKEHTTHMINALKKTLHEGLILLRKLVLANVAGKNLAGAHGISIYFPEYNFTSPSYKSYDTTEFAKNSDWPDFLKEYLK